MKKKGFTLIELMVVIAIIGVLSSVLAPQIFKQINKGRVAAVISFVNALKTASFSYYSDTEQWPGYTYDFTAVSSPGCGNGGTGTCASGWSGPYIDRWPGAGPWAGTTYTWCTGGSCSGGFGGSTARVLTLNPGSSTLSSSDVSEIDKKIDGTDSGTTGASRYSGTTMYFLISAN